MASGNLYVRILGSCCLSVLISYSSDSPASAGNRGQLLNSASQWKCVSELGNMSNFHDNILTLLSATAPTVSSTSLLTPFVPTVTFLVAHDVEFVR